MPLAAASAMTRPNGSGSRDGMTRPRAADQGNDVVAIPPAMKYRLGISSLEFRPHGAIANDLHQDASSLCGFKGILRTFSCSRRPI